MLLEVMNAACGYGTKKVVENVSFDLRPGEILCLLGPNGVGKTTLFKCILGFLKLMDGEILLNSENISRFPKNKLAKIIGYVPQAHTPPFPYKVLDVVVIGRTAHLGTFESPSGEDMEIAEQALETLGIYDLKDRIYTEISGGERQLVLIARALTQQPDILIMDEPTSNLDFGNQVRLLEQIKKLSQKGMSIIMTSHFPNHVFLCSTKVALMQRNDIFMTGRVDEIITEENLKCAYGINVRITSIEDDNGNIIKACIPLLG